MDTPLLKLLGGMRVAELVDTDPGTGGAILLPPVVRRVEASAARAEAL
jgi:hypothetical protein